MNNLRKYLLPALAAAIAIFFTFVGYHIGNYNCKRNMTTRAVFLYDVNGDKIPDAIVLQNDGRKHLYTCALKGKGEKLDCEPPIEKRAELEKELYR